MVSVSPGGEGLPIHSQSQRVGSMSPCPAWLEQLELRLAQRPVDRRCLREKPVGGAAAGTAAREQDEWDLTRVVQWFNEKQGLYKWCHFCACLEDAVIFGRLCLSQAGQECPNVSPFPLLLWSYNLSSWKRIKEKERLF